MEKVYYTTENGEHYAFSSSSRCMTAATGNGTVHIRTAGIMQFNFEECKILGKNKVYAKRVTLSYA